MTAAEGYLLQIKRSEAFNSLQWHDTKCSTIRVQPIESIHEIILELEFPSPVNQPNNRRRSILRLIDCAYFEAAIDLDGKRIVGGALATASCDVSSDWKDSLQKRFTNEPANSLAPYLHFRFRFIAPGAEMNVLGKDFLLGTA